jgi:hypothetical protein
MDVDPKLIKENLALLHAMQSGVAQKMNLGIRDASTEPKHLRVGINNALVEASAIVTVLVDKGVFTPDEYFTALNWLLREEVTRYEKELSDHFGSKITLG